LIKNLVLDVALFILGIVIVLWAAERLTDGVLGVAASFAVSAFFISALVSGFEPENLVTGVVANLEGLSQVALGTVIGAAVFMLLGGFGGALLIVPMNLTIPRSGALAMILSLLPFGWVLLNDGVVSGLEGLLLVFICVALMVWLYRTSPVLVTARSHGELEASMEKPQSRTGAILLMVLGIVGLLMGAEMVVYGATGIIQRFGVSEAFFGMTVVAIGESLEETARTVSPARRGRSDIALGNVVGTMIILLTLNLGLVALVRPIAVDPWVLKFHVPYLIACVLLVGVLLIMAERLGRGTGTMLILLYLAYLAINLTHL
jgi:cation:H+ antiporter